MLLVMVVLLLSACVVFFCGSYLMVFFGGVVDVRYFLVLFFSLSVFVLEVVLWLLHLRYCLIPCSLLFLLETTLALLLDALSTRCLSGV